MMELTKDQIKFHEHCQEKAKKWEQRMGEEKTWTRDELREEHKSWCGERISYTQVCRSFVDPWREQGVIEIDESGKPHQITVKSMKLSTKFPNLENMVEEISDFDYGEEELRKRFYAASKAVGHNPGEEFDFEFNGALDLDSAQKTYDGLQARLAKSGGVEPFDWSLGNRTKSLEEEEEEEGFTADSLMEGASKEEMEEEEPERFCEECLEEGIEDKPAVGKFRMEGREVWLCRSCARAAGFMEGYT